MNTLSRKPIPTPTRHDRLPDEAATLRIGLALANAIESERTAIAHKGLVLALNGALGTGKTTLVRALLRALGVRGPIKSPTFAVLEPYVVSNLNFYHFDLYRFTLASEFADIGFRELFGPGNICAIEWPDRLGNRLPTPDLTLTLQHSGNGRALSIQAATEIGVLCLNHINNHTPPLPASMSDAGN